MASYLSVNVSNSLATVLFTWRANFAASSAILWIKLVDSLKSGVIFSSKV